MRYTRVASLAYAIGALLVAAALGVAWARSRARAAEERPQPASLEEAGQPREAGQDPGAAVYAAECESCHRAGEARGRTPPLRRLPVEVFASEGGRVYLIDFLFDGRVRSVDAGRVTYRETHPTYAHLSDAAAAAVLNYMLSSWGNRALLPSDARLYTAAEVASRRPR